MTKPRKKQKPAPLRIMREDFPAMRAEKPAEKPKERGRYFVDYEGPKGADGRILGPQMMQGIRDRENPDQFDARPGMTDSQIFDEVARLNAGAPVSKVSQGIGRKLRPATEAARWVEVLWNVPETRARLQSAIDTGAKLSPEEVRELMMFQGIEGVQSFDKKGRPVGHPGFPLPGTIEDERKLLDAVSRQLERVLGIKRAEGGRRNEHRDRKKAKL